MKVPPFSIFPTGGGIIYHLSRDRFKLDRHSKEEEREKRASLDERELSDSSSTFLRSHEKIDFLGLSAGVKSLKKR